MAVVCKRGGYVWRDRFGEEMICPACHKEVEPIDVHYRDGQYWDCPSCENEAPPDEWLILAEDSGWYKNTKLTFCDRIRIRLLNRIHILLEKK